MSFYSLNFVVTKKIVRFFFVENFIENIFHLDQFSKKFNI